MDKELTTLGCTIIERIRYDVFKVRYSGSTYTAIVKNTRTNLFGPPAAHNFDKYSLISQTILPLVNDDNQPLYKIDKKTVELIDNKIAALHRMGYLHGNLTAKNIFVQTPTIYFVNSRDFKVVDRSWEQELQLRETASSLKDLARQDFVRWKEELKLKIKDEPVMRIFNDPYIYRFILQSYPLVLNKVFASAARQKWKSLCTVFVIKGNSHEYYFLRYADTFYFDMTGAYRSKEDVMLMYPEFMKAIHSKTDEAQIVVEVALGEYEENPELDEALKAVEESPFVGQRGSLPRLIDSLPYIDKEDIPLVYSSHNVEERFSYRYRDDYNKLDHGKQIDYLVSLQLLDIGSLMGVSPLSVSFAYCSRFRGEEAKKVLSSLFFISQDPLEQRASPLIELCLKNDPWWLAQLLLYVVTNPKDVKGLGWVYKLLANHRDQAKILFATLLAHWNIHYTYMLTLVKVFVGLDRVRKEDENLLEDIVTICMDKSYYDILLTFKKNIAMEATIRRLDPLLLKVKNFDLESLNECNLGRYQYTPMIPVGVVDAHHKHRQHYLHQRREKITEKECIEIIKRDLSRVDILCIINDAPEMWDKPSVVGALNSSIQSYPAEVKARIFMSSFKHMSLERLRKFKLYADVDNEYGDATYTTEKLFKY